MAEDTSKIILFKKIKLFIVAYYLWTKNSEIK